MEQPTHAYQQPADPPWAQGQAGHTGMPTSPPPSSPPPSSPPPSSPPPSSPPMGTPEVQQPTGGYPQGQQPVGGLPQGQNSVPAYPGDGSEPADDGSGVRRPRTQSGPDSNQPR